MPSNVASLLVDMQVNSAALRSGLDQANGHLKRFSDSADRFGKQVAAAVSVGAFVSFGKSALAAFAATEKASAQVTGALKRLGYESESLSAQLRDQASAFQSNLGVSDDMVLKMQAMLVTFGVAPKDIESTTAALLDYAAGMGVDAVGATETLVTAVNSGSTKALKSMGITIKDTGDKTKNFSAAVGALTEKFGGSAATNADTFAGKVAKLSESFGDLQKGFGAFLVNIESKLGIMQKLLTALREWNYLLSDEKKDEDAKNERAAGKQKAELRLVNAQDKLKKYNTQRSDGSYDYSEWDREQAAIEVAKARKAVAHWQLYIDQQSQNAAAAPKPADISETGQSAAAKKLFSGKTEKQEKAEDSAHTKALDKWEKDFTQAGDKAREAAESWARASEEEAEKYSRRQVAVTEAEMENLKEQEEKRKKAAEAFAESAKKAADALETLKSNAINAALGMAQTLLSKTGRTGSLIGAAVTGGQQGYAMGQFAEAAGVPGASYAGAGVGAAVAVVSDLVESSKGFALVVDTADRIIQKTADMMGAPFEGMGELLDSFYDLMTAGADTLVPYMTLLANEANKFAPVLETLAVLWDGMIGVGSAFAMQLELGTDTWESVARGLFDMMKSGGGALLNIVIDVSRFWNDMLSKVADMLRTVADFDIAGAKPFGFLKGAADELGRIEIPTKAVAEALAKLNGITYDTAHGVGELGEAANQATAAFLNAPSGYRIAQARYGASDVGGGLSGSGVTGTAITPNIPPLQVTVVVQDGDPVKFANKFGQILKDHEYVTRGRYAKRRF